MLGIGASPAVVKGVKLLSQDVSIMDLVEKNKEIRLLKGIHEMYLRSVLVTQLQV